MILPSKGCKIKGSCQEEEPPLGSVGGAHTQVKRRTLQAVSQALKDRKFPVDHVVVGAACAHALLLLQFLLLVILQVGLAHEAHHALGHPLQHPVRRAPRLVPCTLMRPPPVRAWAVFGLQQNNKGK